MIGGEIELDESLESLTDEELMDRIEIDELLKSLSNEELMNLMEKIREELRKR